MWHIRKRSLCQTLALYMFVFPFLLNFLQDFLHVPGIIKYTLDLSWIIVLFTMIFTKVQFVYKKTLPILVFTVIFILYASIVYICEYQSVFYFLWGIRNNVRYYIAFFAFAYFLDKDDIKLCMKVIDVLFIVHVIANFFQFFVLGYKWDYLGGIFGTELGCNGNSMILLIIVTVKSLLMCMHGNEKLQICLLKCGISLIIAAMSELKFFYVIFIFILVISAFITRFSFKKVLLFAGLTATVFIGGTVFTSIWGKGSTLNLERIIELITSTSYSSAKDLGRFTAIPIISETILEDLPLKLFGLGLGNCDTSAFAICNTPFFRAHSYLNYDWLSSAFAFIETGYIGMSLFLLFFVIIILAALSLKRKKDSNSLYCEMAIVMSISCIALFFYNSSLRTDIAYIAYFMLALPFVSTASESAFNTFSGDLLSRRQGGKSNLIKEEEIPDSEA